MSNSEKNCQVKGFLTPPPKWRSNRCVPVMPRTERKPWSSGNGHLGLKTDLFHVIHKVPAGDSPYVKAKHVQVIDKDPSRAVSLFWAAINAGDRVDSALKDMAVVMKQLNRSDEAIEAIKSFRHLCPLESQESLDNVLIELYKRSGRIEEEIQLLEHKIQNIEDGIAFDGKRTKMARSQGKKIHVTIEKEYSRLLGNLAWGHLQLGDYKSAEESYRKALSLEPDKNKQCNLAICLIYLNKTAEAKFLLQSVRASCINEQMDESYGKSFERATQILEDLEKQSSVRTMAWEEGICGEAQTPFPSGVRRDVIGLSGDSNGGQSDHPGGGMSQGSSFLHQNKMMSVDNEMKGRAGFWNYKESDLSFPRAGYGGNKRNENQLSNGQLKMYTSPVSLAGHPKDLFTQPRKCLWSSNGDQKRGRLAEEAAGGCNRKLSFEQHKNHEKLQFESLHNYEKIFSLSANNEPKTSRPKASTSENWRRNMLPNHAKTSSELSWKPMDHGECKTNVLETDEQLNAAKDECKEKCSMPPELIVDSERTSVKHFSNVDCEQSSTSLTADNGELIGAAKNDCKEQKSSQQLSTTSSKESHDSSKSKKSWADMVEEEEQKSESGTHDFPVHTGGFSFNKPVSCRSPSKYTDECKGREGFSNENFNTNIVLQTPDLLDKSQNLSQKIESLSLRDGYYTQPHHDTVSKDGTMEQSLSFGVHQNPDVSANDFSSPVHKRALDFGCDNSMPFEGHHATPNGINLLRRNRLQVFQNITPESPRC
ncbi:uncharacterized protein LOC113783707 [Coffea eugenioides]|uniref:uncharacterized protein LOC113783707 n=1 Tax=Coffea eugenioides TaxID=49369 RepID=UPI000F604B22|nr:uncharacterized protein LOC113783707 [Coffea eugenioides]